MRRRLRLLIRKFISRQSIQSLSFGRNKAQLFHIELEIFIFRKRIAGLIDLRLGYKLARDPIKSYSRIPFSGCNRLNDFFNFTTTG